MKTFKDFLNESKLDEAVMGDIVKHKEGDTIHPYHGQWGSHHSDPHVIEKKLASKTKIKNLNTGQTFDVSHATGKVKDAAGREQKYTFGGFHTDAEKADSDDRKTKQREKDESHTAIINHLQGLQNSAGHAVGSLSPEHHAEILAHLEKLKE